VKGIPATPHYRGHDSHVVDLSGARRPLARADENGDRDVIRKILGTFSDQLAR
jgi:hypothetical protein